MTKEELDNLLNLTKDDSKSISSNAEITIFECLIGIYNFSRMLYDKYRSSFDLIWLSRIGLAKKIKVIGYDETFIYLDAIFYNRGSICGHQCVIKIEDVLKYSSKEFMEEFKRKSMEKRLKQLNDHIESNKKMIEQYKEEITKIKAEQNGRTKVK